MNIQGIGIISTLGRGIDTLQAALKTGPMAPTMIDVPFQKTPFPVYAVAPETLKDRATLSRARRADRFSKMAILAAVDAVKDSGVEFENPERVGVIIGTAFGPHPTVFKFLDDILEFGDEGVSPTLFSHSVHNAASSYVSVALGLAGPAMTLTTLADPFQQSLLLAQTWIDQGVCDSVLVGGVEECGTVMEYIVSQKLRMATKEVKPFFDPEGPRVIPGEGAVFFLVGRESVGPVQFEPMGMKNPVTPDLHVVDFESTGFVSTDIPAGCWSYLVGALADSTAVSCATATLMLKNETIYSTSSLMEVSPLNPLTIECVGPRGSLILKRDVP